MSEKRKVLKPFRDGQDKNRPYGINGFYPRENLKVDDERIEYLAQEGFIESIEPEERKELDDSNTVEEIEQELDRRGIEYKKSMKKPEKLSLLDDSDVG